MSAGEGADHFSNGGSAFGLVSRLVLNLSTVH